MAHEGGNKDWATAPVLTCHANVQDFAVLERSGVARLGNALESHSKARRPTPPRCLGRSCRLLPATAITHQAEISD